MQVDYDVPIHTNSETTQETLLTMNSTNVTVEKIFSPSSSADNNGPFRAVDENALIFEFCRGGNLDGVRSLFKRNEGSPWDRDPKGQTPLFVASQCLQLDVAKFLLQEGADPHVRCWNRHE
ncbi:uncharacterized protein K444DRAFT_625850 [Hyaloscypha bicolor E]|uniref:Uncharacterized protein n=1 Tax=Hyaloscypha bicolor E TaxID=1095630 RepID=A0A2J6TNK4_9HELO|nr:uncharacterized protein K444DRAFT_625850 [Hyaloscypha bicolor E]PMD64603.1 hypothetical protein K444DRAFT_625850 [Hyaloscypha bicolor E]